MENHHFSWVTQLFIAVFNCHVNVYQRESGMISKYISLTQCQKSMKNGIEGMINRGWNERTSIHRACLIAIYIYIVYVYVHVYIYICRYIRIICVCMYMIALCLELRQLFKTLATWRRHGHGKCRALVSISYR